MNAMDCPSKIKLENKRANATFHKYFTPNEIVVHDKPDDIWVSYLGKVYDLTPLVKEFEGKDVIKPIIAHAGKDVTEWFHPEKAELLECIHPVTWCKVPYISHGKLPHLGPLAPTALWKPLPKMPWWKDTKYLIGYITKCPRPVRIVNVLTGHVDCIQVCSEDSLALIQKRFLELNHHICSYTWKFEGRLLDMNLTLDQNGIFDQREEFCKFQLPETFYVPTLLIYYNDDLTEA